MDINKQEHISAMLDGELPDTQLDQALADLADQGARERWDIYHQIGDALRSDDLATPMSADFSARFSVLLEAEPVVLAPKSKTAPANDQGRFSWSLAFASAAAAAVVAFVFAPQFAGVPGGTPGAQVASTATTGTESGGQAANGVQLVANANMSTEDQTSSRPMAEPEMLRDPRIDSYLQAHQRFSPALSSGSHYAARSADPASASEK